MEKKKESAELEDAGVEMASNVGGAFATHGRGEKCREGFGGRYRSIC